MVKKRSRWKRAAACAAAVSVLLGAVVPGNASCPDTDLVQESILEESEEGSAGEMKEESMTEILQETEYAPENITENIPDESSGPQTEKVTESSEGSENGGEPENSEESENGEEPESNGEPESRPEESETGNIRESEETESDSAQTESEMSEDMTEEETGLTEESESEQILCTCQTDSGDPWEHDWECEVLLDAFMRECTCGCEEQDVLEHSEDCGAFLMLMDVFEPADLGIAPLFAERPASGKSVTVSAGWTKTADGQLFSPDYFPVRFYPGISSLEPFCSSGSVTQKWFNENWVYFHPRKKGEGGTFGIIYRKVLYYNHRWHDLKMTVVDYSDKARCDGGVMTESYPFMGFCKQQIAYNFYEVLGEYTMKCEILDSETGANARADIRFQWWDIDGAQRFGIRLLDGSIGDRYYYGNSIVNFQTNQTIAGVTGMEVTVGAPVNSELDDPEGCVVYEIKQCSSYYMGVGFRDHIEEDANVLSEKKTKMYNEELESGQYSGARSMLNQTDTSLSVIRTPAPEKAVSNDGSSWAAENTLPVINGEYWYRIRQFVPWQYSNAYYESFVLKDALPRGVNYGGSMKIIREEDGKDVTGWFTVSAEQNVVMASAKNETRNSGDFYGYHYQVMFRAAMKPEEAETVYDADVVKYQVTNTAQLVIKHNRDTGYTTENSNPTVTKASLKREEQPAPKKGFEEDQTLTEKQILTDRQEMVFAVFQQVPVNGTGFKPAKIMMEDTLESCLSHIRTEVKLKKQGADTWEALQGWTVQQKGQTVTAERAFEEKYEGGTLMFQITCRIRRPVDLKSWQVKQEDGSVWAVIPNKAAVSFWWAKGNPDKVTKETNEVRVRLRENHIRLTKEIEGSDIVWDHGNPVFIMKVEGTDVDGQYHRWVEMLEFTEQNTDDTKKAGLTVDFTVPAGVYTASEESVIRYGQKEVRSVTGGKTEGMHAVFDLGSGGDGSAVFYNEKINDEKESHTAFVRNRIGQE